MACKSVDGVSLLEADLDFFKRINNDYGFIRGDSALVQYSEVLKSTLIEDGILARTTGDGFSILLPKISMSGAIEVAERLRKAVEGFRFTFVEIHAECSLTVSVGVATVQSGNFSNSHASASRFLETEAHEALLQAKTAGRNRVFPAM